MKIEEKIIIEALKKGDEKAYRYLYDAHYIVLCRFAEAFLHDPFIAETIVSDVFFHLWEIRTHLNIQNSLRSYLLQSVRNRCLNYLELDRNKYEIMLSKLPLETMDISLMLKDSSSSPLGALLERELEDVIKQAVHSIPIDSQIVFKKSRYELKKNEEIADELGISVNTVKYHLKKSLAFIREYIQKYLLNS